MLINTTRFGPIEVDEAKIITFTEGLLGFPHQHRYALIQTGPDPALFWMQSVDSPHLAFVVCDPLLVAADYEIPIRPDDLQILGMSDLNDCQILVIVNKVNGDLTANLLGPIVVGAHSLRAKQMVLSDKRYSTRHRMYKMETDRPVSKTA